MPKAQHLFLPRISAFAIHLAKATAYALRATAVKSADKSMRGHLAHLRRPLALKIPFAWFPNSLDWVSQFPPLGLKNPLAKGI